MKKQVWLNSINKNIPTTIKVKAYEMKLGDLIPYYPENNQIGMVISKSPLIILTNLMQIIHLDQLQMIYVYELNN